MRTKKGVTVRPKPQVRVRLGDATALTLGGPGRGSEDKRHIYSFR